MATAMNGRTILLFAIAFLGVGYLGVRPAAALALTGQWRALRQKYGALVVAEARGVVRERSARRASAPAS